MRHRRGREKGEREDREGENLIFSYLLRDQLPISCNQLDKFDHLTRTHSVREWPPFLLVVVRGLHHTMYIPTPKNNQQEQQNQMCSSVTYYNKSGY
jgi:hypothetical protein